MPREYKELMEACWHVDEKARPTFETVLERLQARPKPNPWFVIGLTSRAGVVHVRWQSARQEKTKD
jgi:hypothetical protein